jgi:hypothetical protein
MKIVYNGKEYGELSEIQKKVIQNDILSEIFESDMTRRSKYWIESPCEKYLHHNKEKFTKDLKEKGIKSIPIYLVKLGVEYAKEYPVEKGYDDITDIECKVGLQSFIHSKDHRIIQRKMYDGLVDEEQESGDRMVWILQHKYERCMTRLKSEWLPKLEALGFTEIPSDDDELANLIFSQPNYKNRSQRDLEEEKRG